MNALYPPSRSPASIKAGPMPQTAKLPASAMTRRPNGALPQSLAALTWSQLPGVASSLAVGPDGSLWALSDVPAGPDKYIWHYASGTWVNVPGLASSIAVDSSGTVYAVNSTSGGLYYYGNSIWTSLGGGAQWVTTGADYAVYVLSNSGSVDGNSAIWKYEIGAWTQQPGLGAQLEGSFDPQSHVISGVGTIAPNGYYVLTSSGTVYYYSPGTGYVKFPGSASSLAPAIGGLYALGFSSAGSHEDQPVSYFDYASPGWASKSGSGVRLAAGRRGGVADASSQLYVANSLGAIWTTAPASSGDPKITEYTIPTGDSPLGIAAGPDGALWFTESLKIGRITTAGSISEYALPAGSGPNAIAAGPDGALWFTDTSDKIGRITIGGTVAEYPIPADSGPMSIAAGSDGALWFTGMAGSYIGRATVTGSVTELPTLTPYSAPLGIAAGPDGALWFTEFGANTIGRITTAGSITVYPIPTAFSFPYGIAAGPDGALWFTEFDGNQIGRITTAGSITEYPLPIPVSQPQGITAGPDGALWFTEYRGGAIGRISTGGTITEYPLPTPSGGVTGIATGPDGALWFTESTAGKIGRAAPQISLLSTASIRR
jgi:streptogramin lyase